MIADADRSVEPHGIHPKSDWLTVRSVLVIDRLTITYALSRAVQEIW